MLIVGDGKRYSFLMGAALSLDWQMVVEKMLAQEGLKRTEMGREAFTEKVPACPTTLLAPPPTPLSQPFPPRGPP